MYNYGFASVLLSLPQKQLCNQCKCESLKSKVEICKLSSMTPVFLPRYQEARKLLPSPRWSPSQGPSFRSGNSVDSPRPFQRASGSPVCLPARLSRTAPRRLHYQASDQTVVGLVPSVHGGGHTTNAVGVIS